MKSIYSGHRYPAQIISHAVYLYHRFTLSLRDIEELLAYRGINVTYETIRHWCLKFGHKFSHNIRTKRGPFNSSWYLDEVFIKINGQLHYLWRAVDSNGDEIDILVQKRKDKRAAIRFFKKLIKGQHCMPESIVTDKLPSYRAAKKRVMPSVGHTVKQYKNNLCEKSHQPTRQQEYQMRRFKPHGQAQRFLSVHGVVNNLFRLGRHTLKAANYRLLRSRSFAEWERASYIQNLN